MLCDSCYCHLGQMLLTIVLMLVLMLFTNLYNYVTDVIVT